MFFRQLLNDQTACASYLLGCKTKAQFAVVDPHIDLVDDYMALAEAQGIPIVAAFETHLQADHVSGLPALVERTGATAYLPAGSGVEFEHVALDDGEIVELGNTEIKAIATPGHAAAHHAYLVTDHVRGDEPWLVLTGDALLVGDAGRPDLHAHGEQSVEAMAGQLYRSLTEKLLTLPDHILLYPAHYSGSVCGRGLSGEPRLDDWLRATPQPCAPVRLRARVRRGAGARTSHRRPRSRPRSLRRTAAAGRSPRLADRMPPRMVTEAGMKPIAPDLWVVETPLRFHGIEVGRRMTVVRLASGHSWFTRRPPLAPSCVKRSRNWRRALRGARKQHARAPLHGAVPGRLPRGRALQRAGT